MNDSHHRILKFFMTVNSTFENINIYIYIYIYIYSENIRRRIDDSDPQNCLFIYCASNVYLELSWCENIDDVSYYSLPTFAIKFLRSSQLNTCNQLTNFSGYILSHDGD
jgi:hypothetical protein